jgi:RNA polymerase-binding transcription factor DksA
MFVSEREGGPMGATMARDRLERFARRALVERQRSLRQRRRETEHEAELLLEEREPDWEDRAALVAAAAELGHLADNERLELERIGAALARLDEGTWGRCLACGAPIAEKRLRLVPEATRCGRCTWE